MNNINYHKNRINLVTTGALCPKVNSPVKIAFHPGQIATEMILAAHASELYVVSPKKNVGECRWGNLVNFDAKVGKFVPPYN